MTEEQEEILVRVLDYVLPLESEGWVEFLLWEIVEGIRTPPFFWPPLSESLFHDLEALRDDVRIWPVWDGASWGYVPIDEWIHRAAECSAWDAVGLAQSA